MKFNLLEIDLTTGRSQVQDVTEEVRRFLGGRGLGAKLLWDRVPPGADPLSPENVLYLGIGPLSGIFGSVVNVSAKSPLTLLRGQSNMNGHFGVEMAYAGYNAGILLTGKAPKPVYIYIKDDQVELRDASHLWGRLNVEAQQALRQELRKTLDDQHFRIISIGPAGENLVRNADISHDFYHHAARLGMGAVMGSKNVKAIAVRGTKGIPYADHRRVFDLMLRYFNSEAGRLYKAQNRRWGHMVSMPSRYYATTEGIKNKQLGWHDICDLSNPVRFEQKYNLWSDSCNFCHTGCKVPYMRRDRPLGPVVGEFRHDSAGGWNANVMLPGYDPQTYLTPFVDNLGLDNEDVSGVVAWVMECYDRGLITKEDLGGIDLTWGNLKAMCQLVEKIARREGIGDILAEGLKFAPQRLGRDTEKYAMHGKGVAITSYEPRGSMQDALNLVAPASGALHAPGAGGGRAAPAIMLVDSLTTCLFLLPTLDRVFGSIHTFAREMLQATCGWEFSQEEWDNLVSRIVLMERLYSIREGHLPSRDDTLPDRFFEETIYSKYGEPKVLDRARFLELRERFYQSLGLDKDGLPPASLLEKTGLEFAIPAVEKARAAL